MIYRIIRNKYFLFLSISIYFQLFQFISAYSQSDSLSKYLEIAAKNNPLVMQRYNEYQAALQKVPQVGSLSDPELSLGFYLKPMELVNGNQVADIRLMQMFPWFGVLRSAKDEMSLMANAKFELFRDARLQVYYDVQRTWYDLFRLKKEISVSEKNLELLKTIEKLAIIKFQAPPSPGTVSNTGSSTASSAPAVQNNSSAASGMQNMGGSQTNTQKNEQMQSSASMQGGSMGSSSGTTGLADLYRIQIEAGDLTNNIALLKNRVATVTSQFNGYLNRASQTPVYIPSDFESDTLSFSILSVTDSIQANNPMLRMQELEKQSLEARKKMVTRMGYPMVGLGLNYSLISKSGAPMGAAEMNGKDMVMPMVTVTLPIYRKKYNAMKAEAELLQAAASNSYDAVSNSLQTEYFGALQLYSDARRRVKLYSDQSKLASKSLDLMLKSFSSSASSLSDLLRIRQQLLDYELKQAEAIADLNTSAALLKRLMASSQINQE